ncbi:MAG: hypothetical protein EP330_26215 [Deltaproteobacteria bacterium]|nr:MAG: hypothetical protein EP330_26215 [Deltaproteobacteria bacterium]
MKDRRSTSAGPAQAAPTRGAQADSDAQATMGNAFLAQQLAETETTNGPGDEAASGRRGRRQGPAIDHLELASLQRTNAMQATAYMECNPVLFDEPSPYEGERIVEHFSAPWASRMNDRDLAGGPGNPTTIAEVMRHVTTGEPGVFTVDDFGQFVDYHGGHGFDTGNFVDWFTPEALSRGISWGMAQRYTHNGQSIGRFTIRRTIDSSNGVTVEKTPR